MAAIVNTGFGAGTGTETPDTRLVHFYQRELDALRAEGVTFAGQHPEVAEALGLGGGRSPDPHVELLQQSFAFFSARLHRHLAIDQARIPNALAEALYPHLAAPTPSMLVACVTQVGKAQLLPRLQGFSIQAQRQGEAPVNCRFRSSCATPLLPLLIDAAELAPTAHAAGPGKRSALTLTLVREPLAAGAVLGNAERLRVYIDAEAVAAAWRVYELLTLHLCAIELTMPAESGADSVTKIAPQRLRWLGSGDDEAALPACAHGAPAFRLLQEYFAFPQKFMFFEIAGLDLSRMRSSACLRFEFDAHVEHAETLPAAALRLNCVPLVNLFSQQIEPQKIDHTQVEYRLAADRQQHRHHEIHVLESLYSVRSDGTLRAIARYFSTDELAGTHRPDYFYLGRRARGDATDVAGAEYFVSFLDEQLDLTALRDETIGGSALCTNRRLPEQLRSGSELQFEGAAPRALVHTLGKPSAHHMPAQTGERPWQLVSQLALNRLSLAEGPAALGALRQILALHVGARRTQGLRQIAGIEAMNTRALMRLHGQHGRRGFMPATAIHLKLDRHAFPAASPVLFWRVLRHFFILYASVNQLVECSFETQDADSGAHGHDALEGSKWTL